MNAQREMIQRRMALRNEMAQRIAKACANSGLTVKPAGSENTLIVENAAGTEYHVSVTYKRDQ